MFIKFDKFVKKVSTVYKLKTYPAIFPAGNE